MFFQLSISDGLPVFVCPLSSPSSLKDNFVRCRILGWQLCVFFSFQHLKYAIPLPSSIWFLKWNHLLIFLRILCSRWVASLLLFLKLALSFIFDNLAVMFYSGSLWIYPTWISLSFSMCIGSYLPSNGSFWPLFFQILSLSLYSSFLLL